MPATAFKDNDVLVVGGGPTGKWAGDHAMMGGAESVEIAGKMPRPQPGDPAFQPLADKEAQIAAVLADPKHDPAVLAQLTAER